MFFIPHPDRLPNLHVGWTLIHEMLFYLFFVAFFFTKRFSWIAIGWALSIVLYQIFFAQSHWLADFIFNENNILFLAGMLISVIWKKSNALIKNGALLFAAGALIFAVGSGLLHSHLLERDRMSAWFFGLGAICLILAAQNPRIEAYFAHRKTLNFLGDASYSIYLTHAPILAVAAKLITKWNDSFFVVPNFVTWVMLIIIALVAGSACYLIVEKPLIRFFKRRIKG